VKKWEEGILKPSWMMMLFKGLKTPAVPQIVPPWTAVTQPTGLTSRTWGIFLPIGFLFLIFLLPLTIGDKGIMFSGRPCGRSSVFRLLTKDTYVAGRHISVFSGGISMKHYHKYLACEWALRKRFSRSEVKVQGRDQTN